jgi:hypothetical protein
MTDRITPSLARYARPIGDVHEHPNNPRRGNVPAIAASLGRFGQIAPVLALPDGTIIAGNHTYRAAVELGWTKIAVLTADLPPDEADAFLVADNRLSDLATYDQTLLLDLLSSIELDGTGYTPDNVDELRNALAELDLADDPPAEPAVPVGTIAPLGPPPVAVREVVILLDPEQYEQFAAAARTLRVRYETSSLATIVLRALREIVPAS